MTKASYRGLSSMVEYNSGNKAWYYNGARHRVDGPAYIFSSGAKLWYQYGKCHRLDGPAVENADEKTNAWWVNGHQLTEDLHLFDTEEGRLQLVLKYGVPTP